MDLKSILSDNDKNGKPVNRSSSQPSQASTPYAANQGALTQESPPPGQNGAPWAGGYLSRSTPGQQTPMYGPPSLPAASSQSRSLTPLHTSQASGSGQYPFPQQQLPLQSPASSHPPAQQQYRTSEPSSATTPGARPPSHGYSFAQSSHMMGQNQATLSAQHSSSLSPTSSSHHSQTPHSLRQSPLGSMGYHPSQQQYQPPPHSYAHSQPNTPLGPPQLPQRHSNSQLDVNSPYHSRTLSGASSSMLAGSPAQHHPSIGNLVESPDVYNRPRRTSDYQNSLNREQSVSVSPKTRIPPRRPSFGSHHSSQHEAYSARSSVQPSASVAPSSETPSHVQPSTGNYAQPLHSFQASIVAQAQSKSGHPIGSRPVNGISGSEEDNKDNRMPLHHQPQQMVMNHLLTPTEHVKPHQHSNGSHGFTLSSRSSEAEQSQRNSQPPPSGLHPSYSAFSSQQALFNPGATFKSEGSAPSAPSLPPNSNMSPAKAPEVQPPPATQQSTINGPSSTAPQNRAPLKRQAESDLSSEPPAKRGRSRKYEQRPIWAHLSQRNPLSRQPGVVPNSSAHSRPQTQALGGPPTNGINSTPAPLQQQPSGPEQHAPHLNSLLERPWRQNPPLDNELVHARKILGGWERSFQWNSPIPSLTRATVDWLWQSLENNSDIGMDPREGSIEIEAKIGTLIDEDTGRRCELPVLNACVIDPRLNRKYRFESEMSEHEHKNMNEFLNRAVQDAHSNKGRVGIEYKHIRETDSFRTLSDLGMRTLPASAHNRRHALGQQPKLRTSTADKTGQVTARIIKVKLGEDLHIFGALDPYDIRISMNLEINLNRPDLDPNALTIDTSPPVPSRHKDRLSYKHLAYSVDLTRVDRQGMPPKYELELEVDANALRTQIAAKKTGSPDALVDVVEGFINNATYLMRVAR